MIRGKIDPIVFGEFVAKHASTGKTGKGELIREFCKFTGFSRGKVFKMLRQVTRIGISPFDVAAGKRQKRRRLPESVIEERRKHALIVSAIKRENKEKGKYWTSDADAIRIAENMGYFPPGTYTRSTMGRVLEMNELNFKNRNKKPAAARLKAHYPTHVIAVDASPMNHFYMRLDHQVSQPKSEIPTGDTHAVDILEREGLVKIWVYYAVDMFSGAFIAMPFAPQPKGEFSKNGGENADDFATFLKFVFLPKKDIYPIQTSDGVKRLHHPFLNSPFEGMPEILFSDRGSGIGKSKKINNMVTRLGGKIVTHFPGNPSAKGIVESRIGASKRTFESSLRRKLVHTIEDLQFYYMAWANYINESKGKYNQWMEGMKQHKIRRVTEQNLQDAQVTHTERKIDNYGCISVNGLKFFVSENHVGQKCWVWKLSGETPAEDEYLAETEDESIHFLKLSEGIEHDFDTKRIHKKTSGELNRDEAKRLAPQISSIMTLDDILPPNAVNSKLIRLPHPAIPVETDSPFTPSRFESIESARKFIEMRTGISRELSPKKLLDLMEHLLSVTFDSFGYIPNDQVTICIDAIKKYQKAIGEKSSKEVV